MIKPVLTLGANDKIVQITLPNPMQLRGGMVAYIITDGAAWTAVDTGGPGPECMSEWERAVQELGLEWANLRQVVLTHNHWDHSGQAAAMTARSKCAIRAHTGAPAYRMPTGAAREEAFRNFQSMTGLVVEMPPNAGAEMPDLRSDLPASTLHLDGGDLVDCGTCTLHVLHTPGHAADHLCLVDTNRRFAFTGDLVLPDINTPLDFTPGSSGSLAAYLDSIERVAAYGAEWALPSHGLAAPELGQRIGQIQSYHERRLADIRQSLAPHALSAAGVAARLDWFGRSFEKLSLMRQFPSIMEVLAQLIYLESTGDVRRQEDQSPVLYALADSRPA